MSLRAPSHADTGPYWAASASFPVFPRLQRDEHYDVVVVGGGITGLTTAYLLATAGRSVAVLERMRCAQLDTGHTSAHLTMVTDTRLPELVARFGRTHAQAVWDAGLAALAEIDNIIRDNRIPCDFAWVSGYLHAPRVEPGQSSKPADPDAFTTEAALANELGFDAFVVDDVPVAGGPGIRFDGQARVNPRKYLAALAQAITSRGGRIFEHSEAGDFSQRPLRVNVQGHALTCDDIVMATHNPLVGVGSPRSAALFQTKLALYTSYVVAGVVARGTVPDALFWDTADPYHYLRVEPHDDHDVVIFGGEDHKTGQVADTGACYERLERTFDAMIPGIEIDYRWSGQVIETPDGLPFIGQTAEHQYAATGFGGNGLTFGTLGAMMMSDAILGRTNPWADLFDPGRAAIARGLWQYLKENADYPYYRIRDRFAGADGQLRAVPRGEGRVIERDGVKIAAFRGDDGATTLRSAVCSHMGCIVGWNPAARTWDCPCHGSRFTCEGAVLSGPAESPLSDVE